MCACVVQKYFRHTVRVLCVRVRVCENVFDKNFGKSPWTVWMVFENRFWKNGLKCVSGICKLLTSAVLTLGIVCFKKVAQIRHMRTSSMHLKYSIIFKFLRGKKLDSKRAE